MMVAHDGTVSVGIVLDDLAAAEPKLLVEGVRTGSTRC
jgi:hypothetical protein